MTSTKVQTPLEELRDRILSERDKGNVVFWGLPDELMCAKLDDFVKQPADGILYDLNRGEEVVMQFIADKKWVNDFAVAMTIRKLVAQREQLEADLSACRLAAIEECAKVCLDEAERLQSESSAAHNRGAGVTANLLAGKRDTADRLKTAIRALKRTGGEG